MLLGVGATGKLFSDFSALPLHAHRARLERHVLMQYGDALDEEGLWELAAGEQLASLGLSQSQGYVTKNEFVLAMLVRMEKVHACSCTLLPCTLYPARAGHARAHVRMEKVT